MYKRQLEISGAKTEDYSRIKMTEVQNRTEEKQIENILLRKDEYIEFKLERKQRLEAPVEAGTTVAVSYTHLRTDNSGRAGGVVS